LRRARPEDCPELCKRRVELELTLLGEGIDLQKCIKICRSMVG
jgi:hypothetical protein